MITYTNLLAICLFVCTLLQKFSNVFRYYLKFFFFLVVCKSIGIIFLPFFLCRPRNVENTLFVSYLFRPVNWIIGLKWVLKNVEILEENRPCIIIANHQSLLDILGMLTIWPHMRRCTAIARRQALYFWPFGFSELISGLIFIPKEQTAKSIELITEAGEMVKKNNIKLWIFPEGTCYSDGRIHEFKKGAFHLAIKTQMPIVPVVFGNYNFLDHKKKNFESGTAIAKVLPPITTIGKTLSELENLLNDTRQKMITTFDEINGEHGH